MNEKLYQQTVTQLVTEFPLPITILCYTAVAVLIIILVILFRISSQLRGLTHRGNSSAHASSAPSASSSAAPAETEAPAIEVGPGTPFEEFLNEDPAHRELPKKDQFKAYRKWRADKGLNWSA